jgi:hypothetical protein
LEIVIGVKSMSDESEPHFDAPAYRTFWGAKATPDIPAMEAAIVLCQEGQGHFSRWCDSGKHHYLLEAIGCFSDAQLWLDGLPPEMQARPEWRIWRRQIAKALAEAQAALP